MSPEYNWHIKATLKSDQEAIKVKELLFSIRGIENVSNVAPLEIERPKELIYLSQAEAAAYLSVHPKTVYRYVRAEQLAQYRLGGVGHPRYLKEDLDKLLHPAN